MKPRFWSLRTFAALWGIVFAPLVPAAAQERDFAALLPPDTLAYVAWAEPYAPDAPEVEQFEGLVAQLRQADPGQPGLSQMRLVCDLALPLLRHPAGLALLDLDAAAGNPDIQLAGLVQAGEECSRLAEAFEALCQAAAAHVPVSDVEVAGVRLRSLALKNGRLTLYWGVHRDSFLLALGQPAAERIIAGLNGTVRPALAQDDELSFLRRKVGASGWAWRLSGYADARRILSKIRTIAGQRMGGLPPTADKLIDALGINAVRASYVDTRRGPDGSTCSAFTHLEGERKGILKLWDQRPLSEDDLRTVPADAYWALVWNLDLHRLWTDTRATVEALDPNMLPTLDGALALVDGFLGFSLAGQLLPAFGDTWAVFDAPEHGGVLLTGSVLVAEVRDQQAVQGAIGRLIAMLKPLLATKNVNLELRETQAQGRTLHYVVVGRVPCPIMPAWTFVGERMVCGLFPQTVLAAAGQVDPATRGASLAENPAVQRALRDVPAGNLQSLGYWDAAYLARLLYPFGLLYATLGVSMLSVPGVELDPLTYPIRAEAVKDVDNTVTVCVVDGDGVHYRQSGSFQGHLAAVGVVALLVSMLLPSLSRARELAKRTVSVSNLHSIDMGLRMYANDHEGRFPESLEALVEKGLVVEDMLHSPRDEQDGVSYVYIGGQSISSDPANVVAYERVIGDEGTNVLYVDGHVAWLRIDAFKQALAATYQRLGRENELPPGLRP